jgi:hypothetical protein
MDEKLQGHDPIIYVISSLRGNGYDVGPGTYDDRGRANYLVWSSPESDRTTDDFFRDIQHITKDRGASVTFEDKNEISFYSPYSNGAVFVFTEHPPHE